MPSGCLGSGAGALRSWLPLSALIGAQALVVVYVGFHLRRRVMAPVVCGAARDLSLARQYLQDQEL